MQNNPQPSSVSDFKKIKKPWGYEVVWAKSTSSPGYIGKLLYINAGHRLSLQSVSYTHLTLPTKA